MADMYLYKETVSPSDSVDPLINKKLYHVIDQNGGSYNGQIQFDTSVLANSGQWLAYSEAYLEIPFQITMKGNAGLPAVGAGAALAAANPFMMGLKNGYYQIIDQVQVDYNNTTVVQQQPYLNMFVNYKIISSFSKDDLQKVGPSIGFYPDNPGSYAFSADVATAGGDGSYNNLVNPAADQTYASQLEPSNSGLLKRLRNTSYSLLTGALGMGGNVEINSAALAKQIGKNYASDDAAANDANAVPILNRVFYWNILATIRLKDLCDFFDKIPLCKGSFMRLTINYNSFNQTVTTTNAPSLRTDSITKIFGNTNPMIMTSSAANNPMNGMAVPGNTYTLSCGVSTAPTNPMPSGALTQCRLYVPAYSMNSIYESQLITMKPERDIVYTDIYNYILTGGTSVGAGQSFNAIVTNGLVNTKYIVVIPFLSGTVANSGLHVAANVYTSCFDTAPGTTSPFAALTQFQVQVSGESIFMQPEQYDFDAFLDEVSSINAVNGGISTGFNSGLIGQYEWDTAYRFYVADISRRLPMEDSVPKSIFISGINNTSKSLDLVCFVVYERKITIDMRTGAIVP